MTNTPIGLIIKQLAGEKNLKVSALATLTGKARPTIYQTFGRSEMSDSEIEEWAKALGVSKEYLFNRWKSPETDSVNTSSTDYLLEHLTSLEEQFKRLLNQLDVKDRQIEKLMDLLGKLEDVSSYMTARVIPLQSEKAARRA
ncbi:hypothetical protein CLV98_12030 [Dyadobacter jejuensis]|uniref:Uncharacterized protein n=1 Tax=Dyadobacter jejuensis TaxID=1082580 RepID=A0A316AAN3_9BACT|nr:helix-turn-helix transcriptional regulator [Dyadobacter jejuensis]PWJ53914.1 hypothetical protein CLV98_12030 [Dyadobacter jejuensis]